MLIITQLELLPTNAVQLAYGPFISRQLAQEQGLKRYYSGPCSKGHIVGRRVCDWKCPECWLSGNRARGRRYYARHADRLSVERKTERLTTNKRKEWFRQWMNEYRKDPQQQLLNSLRSRLSGLVKKGKKAASTMELAGCTVAQLRQHLEAQFTDDMSWENYGKHGWHVDHIRPCASFGLADPEQQRQCFHYSNLQPLWAVDNMRKGARWQNAA